MYSKWFNQIVLSVCFFPAVALAGNHYTPGVEGLDGAVVPPPGVYYRGYGVQYNAHEHDTISDSHARISALSNRVVWVTKQKLLGADLTFEAIVPLLHKDLKLGAIGINDQAWGVGDIFAGSVLGWHGSRWDAVAGAGVWFDTGKDDRLADPGHGYDDLMLTLGGNYYLTQSKDLSISVLSRYQMADDKDVNDIFLIEWGLNKHLPHATSFGPVGYEQWQQGNNGIRKHAVGLEAAKFFPQAALGVNLAGYREYDATNDFNGYLIRLVLTKAF